MTQRTFGKYSFKTSNEDKILFPASGLTKGQLMDYYERVSDYALPFLKNRPLVMARFPAGIGGQGFYHKSVPDYFPDWISRVRVKKEGGEQDLVVCDKKAVLAYLANQACITPHLWLCRADKLNHPDQLIIDLDPPADDFSAVRKAARNCRELLHELDLSCFLKSTGSKGVHLVIGLDQKADFESVRDFAQKVAQELVARYPEELTTERLKRNRKDRIFVDVARNAYAQTAVAPYAVRALEGAPVATPLEWAELDEKQIGPRSFTMENIFGRLDQGTNPWKDLPRQRRSLKKAARKLDEIQAGRSKE